MIGKKLKVMRNSKGMTLAQLAEKIGKKPEEYTHLSALENGRFHPRDDTIMEILMRGFDMPYSKAKDTLSLWRVEEELAKADNPSKVIKSIINSDRSFIIEGNNNVIER